MLGGLAGAGLLAIDADRRPARPDVGVCQADHADGPTLSAPSLYDFSVEPYRLAEAVWPHVFGLEVPENVSWIQALPPAGQRMIWSPSLYLGAFVLVLALGAAGLRGDPPWRRWLTIVAMVSLVGAMGKFAGPLWWIRWIPGSAALLGGHDPPAGLPRPDAFLPDGAGSVYHVLAILLPGFAMFRYPAKLMVFTVLCASALAGLGWDRLCRGESPSGRTRRWCLTGLVASGGLVLLILAERAAIERWVARQVPPGSLYGPVDAARTVNATLWALVQGGSVYAAGAVLAAWAAHRPRLAGAGALLVVTADLALAGCRIVWTVPQADLDAHASGRPVDRPGGAIGSRRRGRSGSIGLNNGIPTSSSKVGRRTGSPS